MYGQTTNFGGCLQALLERGFTQILLLDAKMETQRRIFVEDSSLWKVELDTGPSYCR